MDDTHAAHQAHPKLAAFGRFLRQIGPAGPMALIATAMPILGGIVVGLLARDFIVPWLHRAGFLGLGVYVIAFAMLGGFALVPTYVNSLLGGFTFKFKVGFPAVMLGLAGASMIGYALAHRIAGHRVEKVIHEHPKWEVVKDALIGGSTWHSTWIVILLRLSPILPFETTNVVLAMCGVRPLPYLIGTIIGIAPRTAAIVFAASTMQRLELHGAHGRWLLLMGLILTAFGAVVIALIAKHALDRATRRQ